MLIKYHRHWKEFGTDVPCPIHFTADELQSHAEDAEGWNEVQDFWDSVSGIVARDGWTPCDRYNDALALFAKLRETGLKVLIGQDRAEFEKQTRWAEKAADSSPSHNKPP